MITELQILRNTCFGICMILELTNNKKNIIKESLFRELSLKSPHHSTFCHMYNHTI